MPAINKASAHWKLAEAYMVSLGIPAGDHEACYRNVPASLHEVKSKLLEVAARAESMAQEAPDMPSSRSGAFLRKAAAWRQLVATTPDE